MKRADSIDASIGPNYQRETFSGMLNTSTKFSRILDKLHKDYQDEEKKKYLVAPYTVMCAAALECRLNDALTEHTRKLWKEDYKDFAAAYLSMALKTKLEMIVPVLTNNHYRINKESDVYKTLASLINVRNKIVHAKSYFEDLDWWVLKDAPKHPFNMRPTDEYLDRAEDLSLGATQQYQPEEYRVALEKLDKYFFSRCPDRLSKIAMVIAREETPARRP